MNILVSNDDGYLAPGIKVLLTHLLAEKHRLHVMAPDRDRSGASNSLTLDRPILPVAHQYQERELNSSFLQNIFHMNATPTDCVHVGLTGLLKESPDLVVSGINAGANMGDDVLYSGTIAAATEGRFLGLPAIAVSLDLNLQPLKASHSSPKSEQLHFKSAGTAVIKLLKQLHQCPLPEDSILNINVPNLAWSEIKGIQATRLGKRHRSEPAIESKDPRNRRIFWLGPVGKEADAGPGTDFYAVKNGYISITPLKINLTDEKLLQPLKQWVESNSFNNFFHQDV